MSMRFRIIIRRIDETDEMKTVYVDAEQKQYDDKYDVPADDRKFLSARKAATGKKEWTEVETLNQVILAEGDITTDVIRAANGIK